MACNLTQVSVPGLETGALRISPLRVLSLSCVFPRSEMDGYGSFVELRLKHLARRTNLTVIAPVAFFDYSRPDRKLLGNLEIPSHRSEGGLEVWHPRWIYPPGGGFLNPWLLSSQLRRPLERLRQRFPFQLIDAHFGFPDGIAAARLSSYFAVPYMITLRGNETMHCRHRRIRAEMAGALRGAARVVTLSAELRQFALSLGAAPERVKTIPNGIDGTLFHLRDRQQCRLLHGLGTDQLVILSAGSLIERKGHHHVVKAVAALHREAIPAKLLIVGGPGREGRFETQIRKVVKEHGLTSAVTFMGQVPPAALAELMTASDVLCLASSREGWPNVVHEAMACGTPVVATAVGAIPDMIVSDDYGSVVPAGNQNALNDALQGALRHGWDRHRIAHWASARNWERVADEVLHEIKQVVS